MLTKDSLINELRAFNSNGKPVIVHTSLKAVGEIDGGAEVLLDALIEHFTSDGGVLCIPTHTWKDLYLDLRECKSCLGVLPTVATMHKSGVRSLHPTHSMVVFGEKEKVMKFVENEENVDSPTHPDGCYGNLYKQDGLILLIGVGQDKNTYIHCVDEMLGIPDRLTDKGIFADIIRKDGGKTTRHLRWFDPIIPDVSVYFGKLEPAFRYYGCITDGVIGNAKVQFCNARKIKDVMELIYSRTGGEEILADDSPLREDLYK